MDDGHRPNPSSQPEPSVFPTRAHARRRMLRRRRRTFTAVGGFAVAATLALTLWATIGAGGSAGGDESAAAEQVSASAPEQSTAAPIAAPASTPFVSASPSPSPERTPLALPTEVPASGTGEWERYDGAVEPNAESGRPFRVAVRVEGGMPIDAAYATRLIMLTLQDERGWQEVDGVAFSLVAEDADAHAVISIASPDTVDRMCAPLITYGELSCRNGNNVVLNAKRWMGATEDFDSLTVYRQYLINHEVGHALGHGHQSCPAAGEPAPVMQQQSKTVGECRPNAWPQTA